MIRLIATDLDGTLLEADGTLPDGIFETINELNRLGIKFAAASGRQYSNLIRLFSEAADEMAFVCENGALNMVDGKEAGLITIPSRMASEIIRDIEALGMNVLISGKHTCYMQANNRRFTDDIVYRLRNASTIVSTWEEINEPLLKISGQMDGGVASVAPVLLKKWGNILTATVSGRDWFDFTIANKGMGMRMLMEHLQIQSHETVVFGDNFNDESMFDVVDHPFLMETANSALRKPGIRLCSKVLPVLRAIADAKGDEEKAFACMKRI